MYTSLEEGKATTEKIDRFSYYRRFSVHLQIFEVNFKFFYEHSHKRNTFRLVYLKIKKKKSSQRIAQRNS